MTRQRAGAMSLAEIALLALMILLPIVLILLYVDRHPPFRAVSSPAPVGVDLATSGPREVFARDGMSVLAHDPAQRRLVVRVDLGKHSKLRVGVLHDREPKGWTVHIGDSETNNGYGGDGASQSHDAEAQVVDGSISVYGSDTAPADGKLLLKAGVAAKAGAWSHFEVSDGELGWADQQANRMELLRSPHLFALDGRPDTEGQPNKVVFVAINRVIADQGDRVGSGASHLKLEFDGAR